jgi:hypothetical protein
MFLFYRDQGVHAMNIARAGGAESPFPGNPMHPPCQNQKPPVEYFHEGFEEGGFNVGKT